ncbi:nucleotidyl transferase AbiEii/AbiGii toxin family protein [Pseudomonas nitroreducens]|uniref:Nucleotidyl transferase AbiEii/AbiGii toxin family protein n=1 Tax=Pseudomonas nitroreducens TaxID=46680 RepID=A0ABS0KK73_PSENT|nr:nucleotidyl transferase AbiEii/AbiGii toxin family protein [Pseudomonas nitroreducens]MBG6287822.1 nucleotidyl transferase AbiEii/AbiGii toxin family protein [Pseudomonas nitroreducens]
MTDFFELSADDQNEVLETAAQMLGRPAYVLEKDIYVVWALGRIFSAPIGNHLTFKGGTSLSKVYRLIDRFSEDLDLTYDVRQMLPRADTEIPPSRAQAGRWAEEVRDQLPGWIERVMVPLLAEAIAGAGIQLDLQQEGDKLYLHYPPRMPANSYIQPRVLLEFGARSTGEPHARHPVTSDLAQAGLEGVSFPEANPVVMDVARTFWEKATAAHVYCLQERLRSERFARHWHDLVSIASNAEFAGVISQRDIARKVAEHKSWFFREKAADDSVVDYHHAVAGNLRLVPTGGALSSLEEDYLSMTDGGMFESTPPSFAELMSACAELEKRLNTAAADGS